MALILWFRCLSRKVSFKTANGITYTSRLYDTLIVVFCQYKNWDKVSNFPEVLSSSDGKPHQKFEPYIDGKKARGQVVRLDYI